jgi:hypothetical protein
MSFFCDLKASEKEKNTMITMTYGKVQQEYDDGIEYEDASDDNETTLLAKEIVETKANTNQNTQPYKFETMRILLDIVLGMTDARDTLSLGETLAFNTFIKYGILIRVENKED